MTVITPPSTPCLASRASASAARLIAFLAVAVLFPLAVFAAETVRAFDVPAGDALQTLKLAAQQARIEIMFPADTVRGIKTNEVKGRFGAREAIERMVANTELIVVEDASTHALSVRRKPSPPSARKASSSTAVDQPGAAAAAGATAAAAPATRANEPGEETITLSPFEVQSDKDTGYLSHNTASGSRLNAALRDTPAAISVFTPEFLQDIAAVSVEDVAKYSANTESDVGFVSASPNGNSLIGPSAGLTVRGLPTASGPATGRTVNFFSYIFEIDTYNTERIEFSRGPNSILFGLGQAGGSFNTQSRTADVKRAIYSAGLRGGSRSS